MHQTARAPARASRWRPVRWIQLGLALTVEGAWLAAWSVALGRSIDPASPQPLLDLPSVAVLLIGAAKAARLAAAVPSLRLARLGLALAGLAVSLVLGSQALWTAAAQTGWPAAWNAAWQGSLGLRVGAAVLVCVVAWLRGIAAGHSRLGLDEIEGAFRLGVIALAAALLVHAFTPARGAAATSTLMLAALALLVAGLISLPLARILDVSERPAGPDEPPLRVSGPWLAMLLAVVAAVLLLALALAGVFSFERLTALFRPLAEPLGELLWFMLYAIALPVGMLIEVIVTFLRRFLHAGQLQEAPQPLVPNWAEQLRQLQEPGAHPPAALVLVLQGALLVLAAVLVGALIAAAVRRFAGFSLGDDVAEDRDFVWPWDEFKTALLRWLRRLFRRPPLPVFQARAGQALLGGPARVVRDARELYRELLRLGARLGCGRALDETPREYEQALTGLELLQGSASDIHLVTDVYIQARYAPEPPAPASVTAAWEALERLHARVRLAQRNGQPPQPATEEPAG
jgi:hypothetical protein